MSAVTSRSGTVAVLLPPFGIGGSLRRIRALVLRYMYLLRSSGIRLLELIYWPFLQMLTWGFLQKYLAGTTSPLAQAAGGRLWPRSLDTKGPLVAVGSFGRSPVILSLDGLAR